MRWGREQGEADEPEAENSPVERGATTKTEVMPLSRKPACPDCLPYCPSQAGITSSDERRALSLIFIPFSYLGVVRSTICRSVLFGRSILLLIIYERTGRGRQPTRLIHQ